jgi:hypothetical protein
MTTTTEAINIDLDLLKKIIRMSKKSLYDFLETELAQVYKNIDTNGKLRNFLFCEGEEPVMVVAHLDTIFEDLSNLYSAYPTDDLWGTYDFYQTVVEFKEIYHDQVEGVMWSPDGLGADDRVGVFMILSLVRAGLKPSILFTTDEESGSASGYDFALQYKHKFQNYGIKYVMELDRAGADDCVFYRCDNPDFVKYIEGYGFVTDTGSFTDISVICPIIKTAGVNLSVGYWNEHSKTEMIDLFTMSKNFGIIYKMIKNSKKIKKVYKFIPKKVYKFISKKESKKTKPKKEEFEAMVDYQERDSECSICLTPVEDFLYAENLGKVCLDCYMEIYNV